MVSFGQRILDLNEHLLKMIIISRVISRYVIIYLILTRVNKNRMKEKRRQGIYIDMSESQIRRFSDVRNTSFIANYNEHF